MSAVRLKTETLYVEDYIEALLASSREKEGVEVFVEEEKEATQKVRVISEAEGKKIEEVVEVPLPRPFGIPAQQGCVTARHKLASVKLPALGKVSAEAELPPLPRISYPLQLLPAEPVCKLPKLERFYIPSLAPAYSYWRDRVAPFNLALQVEAKAYTSKNLLALSEVALKLPTVPEETKAKSTLPEITPVTLALQGAVKAKLLGIDIAAAVGGFGLLELVLPEERDKLRDLVASAAEYIGEPVAVILPESRSHLWYLFWVVCRELYREARGSYPEPVVILPEPGKEQGCRAMLELWLRLYGSFSGKVVVVSEKCLSETSELLRRLRETFSQGLGFLIVLASDVLKAEEQLRKSSSPYVPKIISLREVPPEDRVVERLVKAVRCCFGLPLERLPLQQLDAVVAAADRAYRDFVRELLQSEHAALVRRDVGERESEDHVAMKALVVKVLKESGVKLEEAFCTYPVCGSVADIYVRERGLAIECETLLGAAPAPHLKVLESVRKYRECQEVKEVWIVLRNWPAAIHLGDLIRLESMLRRELKGKEVKFFIPDVYSKALRALDDVASELRELPKSELRASQTGAEGSPSHLAA
ncbi:MAG: hypothetical protein LM590_12255 [Thermofilum sp.]|nr:hypothetical protein [Thermofilum sp.]